MPVADSAISCRPAGSASSSGGAAGGWLWAGLLGAGLGLIACWPSLTGKLIYDDHSIVEQNPVVRGQQPWYAAWTTPYWPTPAGRPPRDILYRPVTTLTFRWNCLEPSGALAAWPYRLTNLALHLVVTVLVGWLATRLWHRLRAGLLAAAWFAVLPVHADALAPAVGRSEMLVGLFGLPVIAYVALAPLPGGGRKGLLGHLAVSVAFLAALFSKEHAVLLLAISLLWSLWRQGQQPGPTPPLRQRFEQWARQCGLGLVVATAGFFFCRWLMFGQFMCLPSWAMHPLANPLLSADLLTRVLTPIAFAARYTGMIFLPIGLNPIWGVPCPPLTHSLGDPWLWSGAAGLAIAAMVMVLRWRRANVAAPLLAGLLISMLLPCHALGHISWLMAERWMYWPSLWWALLVGGLVGGWWGRAGRWQVPVGVLCAAAVGALACASAGYLSMWSDDARLYQAVVTRCPRSFYGQRNMAILLLRSERPAEALPWAERLCADYPDRFEGFQLLARAHRDLGNRRQELEALKQWRQRTGESPRTNRAYERPEAQLAPPPVSREVRPHNELLPGRSESRHAAEAPAADEKLADQPEDIHSHAELKESTHKQKPTEHRPSDDGSGEHADYAAYSGEPAGTQSTEQASQE